MSSKKRNAVVRIVLLIMLALVVCLVSGCSQDNTRPAATATPAVTEAPAEEVTEAPAEEVTVEPTEIPTEEPAEEPAEVPMEEVTEAPAPAEEVTEAPTEEATVEPMEIPTEEPTEIPMEEPTQEPAESSSEALSEEQTAEATEEPAEETAEEPAVEVPVLLATINGQEIWSDNLALRSAYENYIDTAASYGMDTENEDILSMLRGYSMQYALQYSLIFQKAKELGLDVVTDEQKAALEADIRTNWNEIVDGYAEELGSLTESSTDDEKAAARADALAFIKENFGYDEEKFVAESLESNADSLVFDNVRKYAIGDKTVTDGDIREYFDTLVKEDQESYENDVSMYEFYTQYYGQTSYYLPEGYRGIIHILLPVDEQLLTAWKDMSSRLEEQKSAADQESVIEDGSADAETPDPNAEPTATPEPVTEEMVQEAEKAILESVQSTVDEIMAKLESGASFVDLIREYGIDPGMQNEARLAEGYLVHRDSILWDPAFTEAAMALEKVGDISKPFVGQSGVHILQYLRDVPGGAVELTDEMKDEFRTTLQSEQETEALQSLIDEAMESAVIEYTEAGEAWKTVVEDDAEESAEEESTPTDIEAVPEETAALADEAADQADAETTPEETAAPSEPEICTYHVVNTTGEKVTELFITDNATGEKSENYAGNGLADGEFVEIRGANKADYVMTLTFKTESGYEATFATLHFENVIINLLPAPVDATTGATPIQFANAPAAETPAEETAAPEAE